MLEDLAQRLRHHRTLGGKDLVQLTELPPPVRQTVTANQTVPRPQLLAKASDITSGLSRWGSRFRNSAARFSPACCRPASYRQIRRAPTCTISPVVYIPVRRLGALWRLRLPILLDQRQDPHRRVVLLDHFSLRRQPLQVLEDGIGTVGRPVQSDPTAWHRAPARPPTLDTLPTDTMARPGNTAPARIPREPGHCISPCRLPQTGRP